MLPTFVIDESSFVPLGALDPDELASCLEEFGLLIKDQQAGGEIVSIFSMYDCVEVVDGRELHELLNDTTVDRDARVLLWKTLDGLPQWDEQDDWPQPIGPAVDIGGQTCDAYGVAFAVEVIGEGSSCCCLSTRCGSWTGCVPVTGPEADAVDVHFIAHQSGCIAFQRFRIEFEDMDAARFLAHAPTAFPNLCFASQLTFNRFEGNYRDLRGPVLRHLAAIDDGFLAAYRESNGNPNRIGATLGIDLSPESPKTRASEKLMRERDVEFDGLTYRCEWHAKLERHRNRIHIHPGDAGTGDKVLIGIFDVHLRTGAESGR
jgi:hypothetical protein